MKKLILIIPFFLVACAGTPPKVAECKGEFRPVNKLEQKGAKLDVKTSQTLCMKGSKNV